MTDIFMPFTAIFNFLRTPITLGSFSFSFWEFYVAIMAMSILINVIWNYLDGD